MNYLALKWLHLLGAAVLLGTGVGIAFFAWFGGRRALCERDLGLLRGVLRLKVTADLVFTAPAAVLQLATGLELWRQSAGASSSPWLWSVLALFALIGACWLPVVWIQIRLRDMAVQATSIERLGAGFHLWFRVWFWLGVPAFLAVLAMFGLMVARWP